jgi:DNA-binding response OmpR family regulator
MKAQDERPGDANMYNILICDDQPDIVNALKIYLSPEGYGLFEAFNGLEALEMVQREQIHLILLDVMMPRMDGITATAKIREISDAPIILLTAKSETEDKVLGLNVGADDYITKPFVPVEVLARVRSHLRRYAHMASPRAKQKDELTIGGIVLKDREKMKSERMRTELITNVSHDIKTPLTSLINYVDLLHKPHTQAEGEQYLEVQGGAMEVFVDGDLFKVTLSLPCS